MAPRHRHPSCLSPNPAGSWLPGRPSGSCTGGTAGRSGGERTRRAPLAEEITPPPAHQRSYRGVSVSGRGADHGRRTEAFWVMPDLHYKLAHTKCGRCHSSSPQGPDLAKLSAQGGHDNEDAAIPHVALQFPALSIQIPNPPPDLVFPPPGTGPPQHSRSQPAAPRPRLGGQRRQLGMSAPRNTRAPPAGHATPPRCGQSGTSRRPCGSRHAWPRRHRLGAAVHPCSPPLGSRSPRRTPPRAG